MEIKLNFFFINFIFWFLAVNCLTVFMRWLQVPHRQTMSQPIWATTRGISRTEKKTIDRPCSFLRITLLRWKSSVNSEATAVVTSQFTTPSMKSRRKKLRLLSQHLNHARCPFPRIRNTSEYKNIEKLIFLAFENFVCADSAVPQIFFVFPYKVKTRFWLLLRNLMMWFWVWRKV